MRSSKRPGAHSSPRSRWRCVVVVVVVVAASAAAATAAAAAAAATAAVVVVSSSPASTTFCHSLSQTWQALRVWRGRCKVVPYTAGASVAGLAAVLCSLRAVRGGKQDLA